MLTVVDVWVVCCYKLYPWPHCCCVDSINTPLCYADTEEVSERTPTAMSASVQRKWKSRFPLPVSLLASYRMATATITAAVAPSSVCPSQPRQAVPCPCPPPSRRAQPAFPPTTETTATASAAPPGPSRPLLVLWELETQTLLVFIYWWSL